MMMFRMFMPILISPKNFLAKKYHEESFEAEKETFLKHFIPSERLKGEFMEKGE